MSSEEGKRGGEDDEILAIIKEMQNGFITKKKLLVESEQRLEILAAQIGDERGKQLADEMSNFAIVLTECIRADRGSLDWWAPRKKTK